MLELKKIIGRKQIICIAAGVVLYAAAVWMNQPDTGAGGDFTVKRNSYGQGERCLELLVKGLEKEEIPVKVQVGERQYTNGEAQKVFREIISQMGDLIRGGNPSLEEVRTDLKLITWLDQYGIRLEWESEENEIIDTFGTVINETIPEYGRTVYLHVRLTDGIHEGYYQIRTKVYPPVLTKEEAAVREFQEELVRQDQNQRTKEAFLLPGKYRGKPLQYREKEESDYKILLVLGVFLAVLCYAKDQSDEKKRSQKRARQMLLDYSEIVSKLVVFLGAGMTAALAWEKIVKDYENGRKQKRQSERFAYEEMQKTYYQLKSGTPEGQAYLDFGRRCQLQQYMKLSSLLDQNRKTGTKNLRNLLQMEVSEAFEQRKHLAKRMGEEASTKLLVPLFLMLGIVMMMIVVPAFLSFY